jgi:hypothetical protein
MPNTDEYDAAWGLLFLKAAEAPKPTVAERQKYKRLQREFKRLNDWNGANRVARGKSGYAANRGAGASTYVHQQCATNQ